MTPGKVSISLIMSVCGMHSIALERTRCKASMSAHLSVSRYRYVPVLISNPRRKALSFTLSSELPSDRVFAYNNDRDVLAECASSGRHCSKEHKSHDSENWYGSKCIIMKGWEIMMQFIHLSSLPQNV